MKLYLSSFRIPTPDILLNLLNKPAEDVRVGLITNSKDYYTPKARTFKIKKIVDYLYSLNFQVTPIDLREFNSKEVLKKELLKYDLLWAAGGNVFCLRYAMKTSGFEDVIREVLEKGVVYGGDSAGAAVAGKSLRGIEIVDEPEFAEKSIWDGLSLVEGVIIPHVDSPEIGKSINQIIDLHVNEKKLIKLNDFEAFVVNENKEEVTLSSNPTYS